MALSNQIIRSFLPAALMIFSGCGAGTTQFLKKGFTPPKSLAVLPLDNYTNNLDGPDLVRFWMDQRLTEKKGYQTLELEKIDSVLHELGISEGGQLQAISPQKLSQKLGTDALLYGDLLDFTYQTTGFLNVRKVRARFKMVECQTGETLWEGEGLGANSEGALSTSGVLKASLQSLGTQMIEKTAKCPLRTEIWDMIWNAIQYLPSGKGG